jgi:hypothetical protein
MTHGTLWRTVLLKMFADLGGDHNLSLCLTTTADPLQIVSRLTDLFPEADISIMPAVKGSSSTTVTSFVVRLTPEKNGPISSGELVHA